MRRDNQQTPIPRLCRCWNSLIRILKESSLKKKKIQQRITNTLETNGKKRSREVENIKKNQIEILGLINAIIKIKIQLN